LPNLVQMFNTVNSKTSYSRPDEIYSALSEGGFLVYTAVLKEFSGFFLKFDTTTITLTPGQQDYTLPPDLTQLVCLSERQTASENWHVMSPTTLQDALDHAQSLVSWTDWDDLYDDRDSEFQFYGPYLPSAAATGVQTQQITVSPGIDAVRSCQIAYTAKWLPITNQNSLVMLPEEGTYAMQNFAIAEIHRGNNDTLSAEYEAKGQKHLSAFLTWARNRQLVKWPQITPYLGD
jgi:hypothetical protein